MRGDFSDEAVDRAIRLASSLPDTFATVSGGCDDPSDVADRIRVFDLDGHRVGVPADVADPDSGDLTDADEAVIVPDGDDNDAA